MKPKMVLRLAPGDNQSQRIGSEFALRQILQRGANRRSASYNSRLPAVTRPSPFLTRKSDG